MGVIMRFILRRRRHLECAASFALLGFLVCGLGGCAERGGVAPPVRADTPQIGLRRGTTWSVMNVQPPYLSGPNFNLQLKGNMLSGSISGEMAPAGNLHVRILKDGAEGYGPLGPVSIDIASNDDTTIAEGTWNGSHVHLIFRQDSLQGSIAINSTYTVRNDPLSVRGSSIFRGRRGANWVDRVDPLPGDVFCSYSLETLESDGALSGFSTCAGMPQQTRLEVPRIVTARFTQPELVIVLVALLSSPPVSGPSENLNPSAGPADRLR